MQAAKLLPLLMQKDFYKQYPDLADDTIFPTELQDLAQVLEKAHEIIEGDVTAEDLKELYVTMVPIDSNRRREVIYDMLKANSEVSDLKVSSELFAECARIFREQKLAKQIALECSHVMVGRGSIDKVRGLIDKFDHQKLELEGLYEVDAETIFKKLQHKGEFKFANGLENLQEKVPGLDRGIHTIIFAPSNAGKSTLVAQMDIGFLQQGAKVLYVANEEPPHKIIINHIRSASGLTEGEILEAGAIPRAYSEISHNFHLLEAHGMTLGEIENVIEELEPDVVVFDQVDNILPGGIKEDRRDLVLDTMYQRVRMWAAKYKFSAISVTQATKEGVGAFDNLRQDMMKDANISKPASADLIIGIGNRKDAQSVDRCLNLCKNKITGIHEPIYVILDYERCRFIQ